MNLVIYPNVYFDFFSVVEEDAILGCQIVS